jgi:large repetitive protein
MKKKLLISAVFLIAMLVIIYSCKHERIITCADLNFKITAVKTDALLSQNTGTITVNGTGGGEGFQFSIDDKQYQDSGYFSKLKPLTTYMVYGKNSAGCKDSAEVTIGSYNPCDGVIITITTTKKDATLDIANGSISASATGGSGFTYSLNSGAFQASGTFPNLAAGNYTITAKNSNGCMQTAQVVIGAINPCAGVTVTVSTTKVQPTLNTSNGSITASATGGSGFSYSLNNGAFQSGGTFSNLAAGNYTVTAKNSNGCTGVTIVTLTGADPCAGVTVTVTATQVNPVTGQSNGSITASAAGGSGFTYSLNNGTYQSGGTFSNLAAGNYTVSAKNSNGCTGVTTVALVAVSPCAGVTVAVTTTHVNPVTGQSNGSITASATGGSGFTYSLNNGAYQSSGTFSNLATGNYTISAKNSNGCTGVTTVALGSTNPCAGVTISITTTLISPATGQSNGSITVSATGGSGFTYSINSGAFQSSGTFSNLAAGTYTITAKNSNGCLGTKQAVLTAVNPCSGVTVAVTTTQVNPAAGQSNGSITASATGGSGFTYSINNGAFQSGGTFNNLAGGTYTITAKNSNGCLGVKQVILTATDPCAGVTVAVTTAQVNPATGQSNGSITASATGGSGFTYSINNGAFQSGGTFNNLAGGTYTITAKNSNGCLGAKQVTLTATSVCAGTSITITATVVSATPCSATTNNGSISIAASGSTGFAYNNNGGAYQTSNLFANLNAGSYLIGVKDANGCMQSKTVAVGVTAKGPLFTQMRSLITTRCSSGSGCHMNGGSSAGYNFDNDCSIVSKWNQINGACITGALNKMPISPQAPLTAAEKKVITDWIAAGHGYKN